MVSVAPAAEVIEGFEGRTLLHAGPPIDWERVCDPQRRALVAACLLEGWAPMLGGAGRLDTGEVRLAPGNEYGHVGPMTGVCSPSMPVWVVRGRGHRRARLLDAQRGAGADAVVRRRRRRGGRRRASCRPRRAVLARLLERTGPIDVLRPRRPGAPDGRRAAHAQPGDGEPALPPAAAGLRGRGRGGRRRAVAGNHLFFLNLVMAAAKCASLAAAGTAGIHARDAHGAQRDRHGPPARGAAGAVVHRARRAGPGRAPARGLRAEDAALDIGDSAVLECIGLGGMAVAAAPAVAAFFGGGAAEARDRSALMGEICAGRSARFTVPALDHTGSPVGIDARLVVELGVAPQITTGVLHATQGAGQIGAGIAHQPLEPFRDALAALVEELG